MGSWWIGDLALNCYFQSWACETGTLGRSFYWFCFWCVGLMLDGSVIDASVDEMSCLWTWTAQTIWWHLMICCSCPFWIKLRQCGLFSWFFPHPPTLVYRLYSIWLLLRPKHELGLFRVMLALLMRVPMKFWRTPIFCLHSFLWCHHVCHVYIQSRALSSWCLVVF
jgi:hypothetical protein